MNMDTMEMDMMSMMGLACVIGGLLLLILVVLGIVALIKYLRSDSKTQ